jgi:hypothetical protein
MSEELIDFTIGLLSQGCKVRRVVILKLFFALRLAEFETNLRQLISEEVLKAVKNWTSF